MKLLIFALACLLALPACKPKPPKEVREFFDQIEKGNRFSETFNTRIQKHYPDESPDLMQFGFQDLAFLLNLKKEAQLETSKIEIAQILKEQGFESAKVSVTLPPENFVKGSKAPNMIVKESFLIKADGSTTPLDSSILSDASDSTTNALEEIQKKFPPK